MILKKHEHGKIKGNRRFIGSENQIDIQGKA